MAHRLATEYVKTCLNFTEAALSKFIGMFTEQGVILHVHVLDNANQELIFHDDKGQEIILSFELNAGIYECSGFCRLNDARLANLMRKALAEFKGNAIVNRIYANYTIVYHYEHGMVARIVEVKEGVHKTIYEYKDALGEFEKLFFKQEVENEIHSIQEQINDLLDLRNEMKEDFIVQTEIDDRLKRLTYQLFVLEA